MNQPLKSPSVQFHSFVSLLLHLHREMAAGNAESEQTETIREEMEQPWSELSEREQRLVRGLSADLYSIGASWVAKEKLPISISKQVSDATANRDWEPLLEVLRDHERDASPDAVSYLRGVAWLHLGEPDVAVEFLKNSLKLAEEPSLAYLHYYFYALITLGRVIEAIPYAERIANTSDDPLLLLDSSEVFFVHSTNIDNSQVDRVLQMAHDTAMKGLRLAARTPSNEVLSLQCGITYLWLALYYLRVADLQLANQSLDTARRLIPNDAGVVLVESLLRRNSSSVSWDQGVGLGLTRLRGAQASFKDFRSQDLVFN